MATEQVSCIYEDVVFKTMLGLYRDGKSISMVLT